jgi:hypothetical protein
MLLNRKGRQERQGHETKTKRFSDSPKGVPRRTPEFGPNNSLGALCVLCGSSSEFDHFVNFTGCK